MRVSKSGLGSSFFSSVLAAVSPPEVWVRTLFFSMKLGSPLVTNSRGLSGSLLLRTPVVSQMALSLSVHSVMKAASS